LRGHQSDGGDADLQPVEGRKGKELFIEKRNCDFKRATTCLKRVPGIWEKNPAIESGGTA